MSKGNPDAQVNKDSIALWFKSLQDSICKSLETLDEFGKFKEDIWERPGGGGGRTRVIEGKHIEKGGVNFSAVHGPMPEKITSALKVDPGSFFASGVSIVLHPTNPWVPIIHMNVRYFEMDSGKWWFGGGIDLTPHYITFEDGHYLHKHLKSICDQHDPTYYLRFKTWADEYFFIRHRRETRGVGGIFFDRLSGTKHDKAKLYAFVRDVGNAFIPIYRHYFLKSKNQGFTDQQKQWQYLRRGRYVEFNLVWDKGTKFGLDTDGRSESILMSLPPLASWKYDFHPAKGSLEAETQTWLRKGIDWLTPP